MRKRMTLLLGTLLILLVGFGVLISSGTTEPGGSSRGLLQRFSFVHSKEGAREGDSLRSVASVFLESHLKHQAQRRAIAEAGAKTRQKRLALQTKTAESNGCKRQDRLDSEDPISVLLYEVYEHSAAGQTLGVECSVPCRAHILFSPHSELMGTLLTYGPSEFLRRREVDHEDKWDVTSRVRELVEGGFIPDVIMADFVRPEAEYVTNLQEKYGTVLGAYSFEVYIDHEEAFAEADLFAGYWPSADIVLGVAPWLPGVEYPLTNKKEMTHPALDHDYVPPDPAKLIDAAVVIVSHCMDNTWRAQYVLELMKHMSVESLGRCWTTPNASVSLSLEPGKGFSLAEQLAEKHATVNKYKFVLLMENTLTDNYFTEKFFDAFLYDTVIVYAGPRNAARMFPDSNSFVDLTDFPEPANLAAFLKDMTDEEWKDRLLWKRRLDKLRGPVVELFARTPERFDVACQVCQYARKHFEPAGILDRTCSHPPFSAFHSNLTIQQT